LVSFGVVFHPWSQQCLVFLHIQLHLWIS
jgi:hypothetical protein